MARDSLTRAGAADTAAVAVARSVGHCEARGDRTSGIERLVRLVEGLRTGAINGTATPVLSRSMPALIRVDADFGFADAAIEAAFETLTEVTRSYGLGFLAVAGAGDETVPAPWIDRLAEHKFSGLFLCPRDQSSLSVPGQPADAMLQNLKLPTTAVHRLIETLVGPTGGDAPDPDMPLLSPVNSPSCFVSFHGPGDAAAPPLGDNWPMIGETDEPEAVQVPSALLEKLLTA